MLLVVSLVVLGDLDDDSFVALAVVNSAVMGNNVVDFSLVVDSLVVTSGVVDFSVVVDSFAVVDFPVVVDSNVVTSEDVDFSVVVDFVVVSGVVDFSVVVDSVISTIPEVVTGVSELLFVALETPFAVSAICVVAPCTLGEVLVPVVLFADPDEF